jgi:AraC-like DNA-binding protein
LELLDNHMLVPSRWAVTSFDEWHDNLQSICGHFNPVPQRRECGVYGAARAMGFGGMDFAHVSNNLDRVYRTTDDIKRDDHEHLFLIVQIEGQCGVEQVGRQSVLDAGDCILVDSTKPSVFHFGGCFSNHLSLHLPRQSMYWDAKVSFDVARKIESGDPMAVMLRALIAKIMQTSTSGNGSPHLRDLIFTATRQAFVSDGESTLRPGVDCANKRLQMIDVLIDRHLTDGVLGAKWLANRVGVSVRTLQDDFQGLGMTCTTVIRDRRLRLAREKLQQIREARSGQTIAEVAYSTGFNDISYFNRSFRQMFDCAPSELLKQ